MKLNTITPLALVVLLLHACTGCTGSIDYTQGKPELHISFKSPTASADKRGDLAPQATAVAHVQH